ncbi:hypothetical protein Plhal304r1_c026g0087951 [Plasmopara halstedii]
MVPHTIAFGRFQDEAIAKALRKVSDVVMIDSPAINVSAIEIAKTIKYLLYRQLKKCRDVNQTSPNHIATRLGLRQKIELVSTGEHAKTLTAGV